MRARISAAVAMGAVAGLLGLAISPADAVSRPTATATAHGPSRDHRIAVLRKAEARIAAAATSKDPSWGDLDLRDLRSFHIEGLWNRGIDGYGTSVAVIEGWNLPGIQKQLNRLDDQVGLPHTTVQTVYPDGPLPATCPPGMQHLGDYGSCAAWGGELTLDVEAVHLFAPYAKIVISATPADSEITDDASSQVAPPEMMKALEYLSAKHLANVISISDGSNEGDYAHGPAEIRAQDPGELAAAAAGVPVVAASGDCGARQNLATATGFCNALTTGRAVATWDDSPFVTAVGGVTPDYTYLGRHGQDGFSVWNDSGFAAEGAGFSKIFARPDYQDRVASITGSRARSLPDITMNGADGTSQSAPQFAAVLALATQLHGGDLGSIDAVLYDILGRHPAANGLVDVTRGDNTAYGVAGFAAAPGFDVATGWGTVNAAVFAPALSRAVDEVRPSASLGAQASRALHRLEIAATAVPAVVRAGGSTVIRAGGFLPGHPVAITVRGGRRTVVFADGHGRIRYRLSTAHLGAGRHVVKLRSMLITKTALFRTR